MFQLSRRVRHLSTLLIVLPLCLAVWELFPVDRPPREVWRILYAVEVSFVLYLLGTMAGVIPGIGTGVGFNQRHCLDLEDRVSELEALLDVPEHLSLTDLSQGVEDLR